MLTIDHPDHLFWACPFKYEGQRVKVEKINAYPCSAKHAGHEEIELETECGCYFGIKDVSNLDHLVIMNHLLEANNDNKETSNR